MSFSAFDHHHQVKDNNTLLMFGGDQAACSTSDGSNCYTSINNNNNNHHQVIIKCEDQGINIMQQNYDANFCNNQDHQEGKLLPSGNSCNNTSVLDYGLEEIKQLISTNINVGNIFNYSDESKLMYYYWSEKREKTTWWDFLTVNENQYPEKDFKEVRPPSEKFRNFQKFSEIFNQENGEDQEQKKGFFLLV